MKNGCDKEQVVLNLECGEEENDSFRRCSQVNCRFYVQGDCKCCESCSAPSFILSKKCSRCLACENIPNQLRWNEKELEEEMAKNKLIQAKLNEMLRVQREVFGKGDDDGR